MNRKLVRRTLGAVVVCGALAAIPSSASAATGCDASGVSTPLNYSSPAVCSFQWKCVTASAGCGYYPVLYAGFYDTRRKASTLRGAITTVQSKPISAVSASCTAFKPANYTGNPFGSCTATTGHNVAAPNAIVRVTCRAPANLLPAPVMGLGVSCHLIRDS